MNRNDAMRANGEAWVGVFVARLVRWQVGKWRMRRPRSARAQGSSQNKTKPHF